MHKQYGEEPQCAIIGTIHMIQMHRQAKGTKFNYNQQQIAEETMSRIASKQKSSSFWWTLRFMT